MTVRAMEYEVAYAKILLGLDIPFLSCPRPSPDVRFLSFFSYLSIHILKNPYGSEVVPYRQLIGQPANRLYPYTRLGSDVAERYAMDKVAETSKSINFVEPLGNVAVGYIIMLPGVLDQMAEEPELAGLVSDIQGVVGRGPEPHESLLFQDRGVDIFADELWVPRNGRSHTIES